MKINLDFKSKVIICTTNRVLRHDIKTIFSTVQHECLPQGLTYDVAKRKRILGHELLNLWKVGREAVFFLLQ